MWKFWEENMFSDAIVKNKCEEIGKIDIINVENNLNVRW